MIALRGITWDHPRGYEPLVATAQAYMSSHPGIGISWQKRSLQEFADYPIERLADQFDLLVIDHPFVGFAAAHAVLEPLDRYLNPDQLGELERQSVGKSHASYCYDGRQWALAIDAAAHVSVYRQDLMDRYGHMVPRTWDEVLRLAHATRGGSRGWVAVPLIPVDTLMCFYTLCASAGEDPFSSDQGVVSRAVGRYALEVLRALTADCHPESLQWNPPGVLDRMSSGTEIMYCPMLFGYSNYGRVGFRTTVLQFADIPVSGDGPPRGAILGGTGLSISRRCKHPAEASEYAAYVASAEVQCGLYFDAGGQPGYRAAWTDTRINRASNDFFVNTLRSLDGAYLRPRFDGYMAVQERAGAVLHQWLRDGDDADAALRVLDALYSEALVAAST
jgi:multiple sugar transport system substrate-binding protein